MDKKKKMVDVFNQQRVLTPDDITLHGYTVLAVVRDLDKIKEDNNLIITTKNNDQLYSNIDNQIVEIVKFSDEILKDYPHLEKHKEAIVPSAFRAAITSFKLTRGEKVDDKACFINISEIIAFL